MGSFRSILVVPLLVTLPFTSGPGIGPPLRPASHRLPPAAGPTPPLRPTPAGPTFAGPTAGPIGALYLPPVDAVIVDHFRPPACLWCPGNRGIDYATVAGGPVGASAPGVVTFAGQVGGQLFVVVAHADGLRTTYAFLASIAVAVGDRVAARDVVGTSGTRLHFGVRRGDVYLDPELLFRGAIARPRLVPTDGGPARAAGWSVARVSAASPGWASRPVLR